MPNFFDLQAYDFHLPEALIAQQPAGRRDASRLLQIDCPSGQMIDLSFADIADLFRPGDLLVVNDTKVFPARLLGRKESGGKIELLLLHYPGEGESSALQGKRRARVRGLAKSSRRPQVGSRMIFGSDLEAEVIALLENGAVEVDLLWNGDLDLALGVHGKMPLPPYIRREISSNKETAQDDKKRYQTVYAQQNGAVAAPTAGLHFTEDLLAKVKEGGVNVAEVTLHVGYGTFAPVRVSDIRDHVIHAEHVTISEETATRINATKEKGGRIWAVGTTSARSLEFAADGQGGVRPVDDECQIYIYPGYEYQVVDNMITNFHLPKSSLLFMVSAFAGYDTIMRAYKKAVDSGYRFFSYGDAMALITKK